MLDFLKENFIWLLLIAGLCLLFGLLLRFFSAKCKKNERAACSDPVTSGLSEAAFQTGARKVLQAKADSFALVSVQIENLSEICTCFGPAESERMLKHLHGVLNVQLSSEELLARTGEGAFCFLLKNRKTDEIFARLNRICDITNRFNKAGEDAYALQLTFGIYLPEKGENDIKAMLGKTILARLSCPSEQRYSFYDRSRWDKGALEREMAASIDHSLQINEFVVYYQPTVRILDQRVVGAEALIRWRHPQRGLLSPDMFLPLAAQYQKSSRIDQFVFEDVCRTLARWQKQGKELCPISVNLSRADLTHPNFAEECYDTSCRYGVDPANIEFEINEELLMANMDAVKSLFNRFHALGFRCAVDNFGAKFTSLQILGSLEIDTIKLDHSFFSGDNNNRRGRYVAEAILKLATQLQIRTVAEGIESPGQAQYLQQMACDVIQGYYYFKPMPLERFEVEVYANDTLKYVESKASAEEQGEKKYMAIGQTAHAPKSIIQFSYLPVEDTVEFSEAFSPILGNRTKLNKAMSLFRTTELVHENDREDFFRLLERCQREDGWVESTLRFYLGDRRYGWLEVHMHQDTLNTSRVISGTMINMTELKNEVNRWKEKATRDPLTGLYNREYFEHNVQTQLEQKLYPSAAMLFIDVDDFKNVNDSFGHKFGDDVLCYVAKQVLGVFRHTDIIARYGGDEFVVFAPSIERPILEQRLTQLCGAFKFPFRNNTVEYKVSGSIGAAMYPQDGTDFTTLLARADQALYEAKNRGKDQFVLFEPYMQQEDTKEETTTR